MTNYAETVRVEERTGLSGNSVWTVVWATPKRRQAVPRAGQADAERFAASKRRKLAKAYDR